MTCFWQNGNLEQHFLSLIQVLMKQHVPKSLGCVCMCECVCSHVYTSAHKCTCVCLHVCTCVTAQIVSFENWFSPILLKQDLTCFCLAAYSGLAGLLASRESSCLPSCFSKCQNYRWVSPHLSFLHGFQRLNSNCQACTAVLLSTETFQLSPTYSVSLS